MRLSAVYDWLAAHRVWVDAAAALILLIPCLIGAVQVGDLGVLICLVIVPVLALRRVHPVLTFAVVSAGCLVQVLGMIQLNMFNIAFPLALYTLAAYTDQRWLRLMGLPVAWLAAVVASVMLSGLSAETIASTMFMIPMMSVVWIAGDLMGHRRLVMSRLREQNIVLARDQAQRERLAAQAERARIAREMHDIVAHNLSVIVVQADGAAYQASLDPAAAGTQSQQTLETIATTARSALAETRRLVGVLRTQDEEAAEYRPTASLEDIDSLVERVVASGLQVSLRKRGTPRLVSPDVGLAAYRIVQEALTNVMKHAGPYATADVVVDYGNPLGIVVRDTGNGAAAGTTPGGNGLIGMRERVEAVGGSVHAGPDPDGGFRVSAYLTDPQRGKDREV